MLHPLALAVSLIGTLLVLALYFGAAHYFGQSSKGETP